MTQFYDPPPASKASMATAAEQRAVEAHRLMTIIQAAFGLAVLVATVLGFVIHG